jgi:hypothetical protein
MPGMHGMVVEGCRYPACVRDGMVVVVVVVVKWVCTPGMPVVVEGR